MNPTRFRNLLRIAIVISLMPSFAFAGNILSIGIGASPNDATGDPLRTAMIKIVIAVNGLAGCFNGPSEPASSMPFQCWFDTSATPPTLRYYDGTQWVGAATLNQSTHVFASLAAPSGAVGGDLGGTLPNPTINLLAVTNAKMATDIGALAGDLAGTLPSPTIAKIQGTAISGVTGTGNVVLNASPTLTGTATIQGLLSSSGGGGYTTTTVDNGNDNTNGIQVTGTSTTQAQEITKSPVQITWNPSFTGNPGGTFDTAGLTVTTNSTKTDRIYPWGIIGIVNNNTDVLTSGNPNAVAINGSVFPKTVKSSQSSSSWGGNFVCDETGAAAVVNPTHYCIGAELDVYEPSGSGTDSGAKRIGLVVGAGPKSADTTVHSFAGIDIGTVGTIDNGITFFPLNPGGTFGNLINAALPSASYTNFLSAIGFNVDNVGNTAATSVSLTNTTFAALPACTALVTGTLAVITDASSAPSYNAAVSAGGGTNVALVMCRNGSWTFH